MAGERHLRRAGEDAHAGGVRRILGRQHEGGLAQVELVGEGLHLRVGEAARVGEHGERVAAEAGGR